MDVCIVKIRQDVASKVTKFATDKAQEIQETLTAMYKV